MNAPETITPPANATAVALLTIAEIVASHSNPRKHFDDTYLAELAESIKAHGVIQPITVRPLALDSLFDYNKRRKAGDDSMPQYEIVVGECRWRAAKLAGLTHIPAFWRELDDKQVLEIQVVENLQRRDVHPIEEAEGYQALIERHGYNADQLAAKIGKSRSYIYGRLKLTALCTAAREACYAGTLSDSTALLIARIPGEALQKKAVKEVTTGYNGELSYRAAKQHIHSRYTLSLKQATFAPDDATLLPAAGACSACPKLSGNFHDLFNDIEAADVCTDPDCFEAKHQARRDRLIANAEARKIPVVTDPAEASNTYFHDDKYVRLDEECEDDAEGRTYRQILGDAVPVVALVKSPYYRGDLTEFAEATAIDKALKKAGWKPAEEEPPPPPKNETAAQKAARIAQQEADVADRAAREAEREQAEARAEAETERRTSLRADMLARLETIELDVSDEADGLIRALVCAWLANEIDSMGASEYEDELRQWFGIELPEEYDDREVEPGIRRAIATAPLGKLIGLMLAAMTRWGIKAHWSNPDTKHPVLELAARALRLDAPSPTPSQAAPAGDEGQPAAEAKTKGKKPAAKKAKSKADPAPASPANEAAAPPKTVALNNVPAWPFPQGRAA